MKAWRYSSPAAAVSAAVRPATAIPRSVSSTRRGAACPVSSHIAPGRRSIARSLARVARRSTSLNGAAGRQVGPVGKIGSSGRPRVNTSGQPAASESALRSAAISTRRRRSGRGWRQDRGPRLVRLQIGLRLGCQLEQGFVRSAGSPPSQPGVPSGSSRPSQGGWNGSSDFCRRQPAARPRSHLGRTATLSPKIPAEALGAVAGQRDGQQGIQAGGQDAGRRQDRVEHGLPPAGKGALASTG